MIPAKFDLFVASDSSVELQLSIGTEATSISGPENSCPTSITVLARAERPLKKGLCVRFWVVDVSGANLRPSNACFSHNPSWKRVEAGVHNIMMTVGERIPDGNTTAVCVGICSLMNRRLYNKLAGTPGIIKHRWCSQVVKGLRYSDR